jgi:hypothetical protein
VERKLEIAEKALEAISNYKPPPCRGGATGNSWGYSWGDPKRCQCANVRHYTKEEIAQNALDEISCLGF